MHFQLAGDAARLPALCERIAAIDAVRSWSLAGDSPDGSRRSADSLDPRTA